MVVQMQLVFQNPEKKYFSGQTVSGRLIVNTDGTISLRNISVKFQGKAKTCWKQGKATYFSKVKYFKNIITLYGGTGHNEKLQPGEHSYAFGMLLPVFIPSSFDSKSGHVHYKVKAKVELPLQRDPTVEEVLNVISPIDLNKDPQLKVPLNMESHKYFCCFCCKKGPLTLVSKIALQGYVPGDVIQVFVEVDNASDTEIMLVKCRFRRDVKCYTVKRKQSDLKTERITSETLEGSVPPFSSKTWRCNIQVPPTLIPSFLNTCLIIDTDYYVQVLARPKGVHKDLVNNMPIIIGTTPIITDHTISMQRTIYHGIRSA